MPLVLVNDATKQGYAEAKEGDYVNLAYPQSKTRRGRVGHQVAQTLQCNDMGGAVDKMDRIRKLTPKEYFRLMGFDDADYQACADNGISNSQLYKMAGNSIVVNVLEHIYKQLDAIYNLGGGNELDAESTQMTIYDFTNEVLT